MKLNDYYSRICQKIKVEKDRDLIIKPSDFLNEEITLVDEEIIIRKGRKSYSGYGDSFVDFVLVFITKEKAKFLAFAVLNSIFNSNENKIKIKLSNQYSDINFIFLEPFTDKSHNIGIICSPIQYEHVPCDISVYNQKYRFADSYENKVSSCLRLEKEFIDNYEEFKSRDIFQGFGSISGTEKLINLLFDFSLDENEVTELTFENEIGFGQLTPGSCEFSIVLLDEDCPYNPKVKYDPFFN